MRGGEVIWLLNHSPTLQCHYEDVHVQPDECPRDLDGYILFSRELHPFYPSLSYACSVSSVSFSVPISFLTQVSSDSKPKENKFADALCTEARVRERDSRTGSREGCTVSFTQSTASAGHPAGLRVQIEPLTGSRRRPSISCPCLLMSFLPLLRIIPAGLTIWPVWEVPGGHTFTNPVSSALALELLQLQMLLRIS